jgi:hypothetical protein
VFKVRLLISHSDNIDSDEYPLGFILSGTLFVSQPSFNPTVAVNSDNIESIEDLDDLIEISFPSKRTSESLDTPIKRLKVNDVIELD